MNYKTVLKNMYAGRFLDYPFLETKVETNVKNRKFFGQKSN